MRKNIFEIYLTTSYVSSDSWLKLIYRISKINGTLKKWNLWVSIENNYVRYYVETKNNLPPTISDLGDFLIKKQENKIIKEKYTLKRPCLLTKNYKTVIDLYDKNEAKKELKLTNVKITFYPYKSNNYLSKTYLYLKDKEGEKIKKRLFNNSAIHKFISLDFDTYTRFFYQKQEERYLDVEKAMQVMEEKSEKSILSANVFPYMQDELYLNYDNYDFAKHTVVVRSKRKRKIKICKLSNKNNITR